MKINWVLSDRVELDHTVNISQLKDIGSFWGSWRTWRAYSTDNVVCYEMTKADELIKRSFQNVCNFYISNSVYTSLDRPAGVKLFEGNFIHDLDNHEEIVAMHLAASTSDIILLLGFDFSNTTPNPDKLLEHRAINYRNLVKQAIKDNPGVQWLAIDHQADFRKDLFDLPNLSKDTLSNVIGMLSN